MKTNQQRPKRRPDIGVIVNATACTLVLAMNVAALIAGLLAATGVIA